MTRSARRGQEAGGLRDDDLPTAVLDAARRLEPAAVEAVYLRYAPAVTAFLRARVGGDADLAADLTGDAFEAVLRALPTYRGGPEAFAGWLFTLVRRDLLDHRRRRDRRPELLVEDITLVSAEPIGEDVADEVVRRDDALRVRAALAELTVEQREVLVLRTVAGLSGAEVAAATGRTTGAVKAMQHRALLRLEALLGGRPDPYPRDSRRRL